MEEAVYRVSKVRMVAAAAVVATFVLGALALNQDQGVLIFAGVATAALGLWLLWVTGLEFRVSEGTVSRTTRLGTVTIRWDQLTELRYRGEKRSAYLVPIGTYVTLWLRDETARRLTIAGGGNAFGYLLIAPTGVQKLQQEVLRLSLEPLVRRLGTRLDAGDELVLGPVSLSLSRGLRIKRMLRTREVPLGELAGFGVHEGLVHFFRAGEKSSEGAVPVSSIPNCFALLALLEGRGVRPVSLSAGFLGPRAG